MCPLSLHSLTPRQCPSPIRTQVNDGALFTTSLDYPSKNVGFSSHPDFYSDEVHTYQGTDYYRVLRHHSPAFKDGKRAEEMANRVRR